MPFYTLQQISNPKISEKTGALEKSCIKKTWDLPSMDGPIQTQMVPKEGSVN